MTTPRYAYAVTGHIFYDNGPDETVRFIYDMYAKIIVEADVLRSLGWKTLSDVQLLDLAECMSQYTEAELLADDDFEFDDQLCEWNDDVYE